MTIGINAVKNSPHSPLTICGATELNIPPKIAKSVKMPARNPKASHLIFARFKAPVIPTPRLIKKVMVVIVESIEDKFDADSGKIPPQKAENNENAKIANSIARATNPLTYPAINFWTLIYSPLFSIRFDFKDVSREFDLCEK